MTPRHSGRRRATIGLAVVLFSTGLVLSLSIFTPPATSRTSQCTVACLPTTVPTTLPTTVPTLPPPTLPPLPTTTTTTTTTPTPPAPPPPSPPPAGTTSAAPTLPPAQPAAEPSSPSTPGATALALSGVKLSVVGRGARRFLVVRVGVNKPASARTALLRAKRTYHRGVFGLRHGVNVRRLRLPARLRPGRFTVHLVVRDVAGSTRTVRRFVRVRG